MANFVGISTGRSRRHQQTMPELPFRTRFGAGPLQPAPATPSTPPCPHGDLTTASAEHILKITRREWHTIRVTLRERIAGVRLVLGYLARFDGDDWQQRWQASALDSGSFQTAELAAAAGATPYEVLTGIRVLFALRVVRPSLVGFRAHKFSRYPDGFRAAQHDPLLDEYFDAVAAHDVAGDYKREALFDVCCLLTVQGISLADVTPQALLYHAHESRRHGVNFLATRVRTRFACLTAWDVMHRMGRLPAGAPATLRAALVNGQRTVEGLVERYPLRNRAVKRLLIDYLLRRQADTDYSSLENLARILAHIFWERIEQLDPDQTDLRLDPALYARWRESVRVRDDGRPRTNQDDIVMTVRSLYLDLHTWAVGEPERWAAWAAPNPVPPAAIKGYGSRRRRVLERTADRIRERQPLLPALVEHVQQRHEMAANLLARGATAGPDERFTVGGRTYRRLFDYGGRRARRLASTVHVVDEATGKVIHVTQLEEAAFWDWAIVETLRHTGVRLEELCELARLSIRQYQRPNGEVIALLVIAPSKTDRERVIPMSAELFHVIAAIVRRHTQGGRTIPLLSRFDSQDKIWSPAMPFLFQRRIGSSRAVISTGTLQGMLRRRCEALAEHNPAFRGVVFTPHDFRRLFATELVNSGLPVHIGAALLGHLDVQTTRGYVAVFEEDLVRHYQAHLARRRMQRPADEYRPATTDEWTEFEDHFDKRKVELGSCGRPYGTPCQHEHACVRCPMLRVDPEMLSRIDELEADLLERRARAETERWLGEMEGIDLTLTFLRDKRREAQRLARTVPIQFATPPPPATTDDPAAPPACTAPA